MGLTECRRLATKINQHMQQLNTQDVNGAQPASSMAYALQLPATWRLKVDRRGQHRHKDWQFQGIETGVIGQKMRRFA